MATTTVAAQAAGTIQAGRIGRAGEAGADPVPPADARATSESNAVRLLSATGATDESSPSARCKIVRCSSSLA
jgi:hypothetical protein